MSRTHLCINLYFQLSVIVFVGLLYVQTEETKADEGTDLVKRLIESVSSN